MSYESPSSVRLPRPLRERIRERASAERRTFSNQVVVLLESALDPREPAGSPFAGQPLGAFKLVAELALRGLDVAEIVEATGLEELAVAAVHERVAQS